MEEMKNCPYCGEEILAVAKKCKHCGEWLEEDKPEKPKEQVPCPVCAEMIDEGTKVCPFCHEELIWEDNYEEDTTLSIEEERKESEEEHSSPRGFWDYCFADPILHNYFNFKEPMSAKQFWLTFLAITVVEIVAAGATPMLDPTWQRDVNIFSIVSTILIVPLAAIMWRRGIDVSVPKWVKYVVGLWFIYLIGYTIIKGIIIDGDYSISFLMTYLFSFFLQLWVLCLPLAIWFSRSGSAKCKKIKFQKADWFTTIMMLFLIIFGLCCAQ